MAGWLAGWLDGWLDGWMAGWMAGWLDGWLAGWLAGWLDGWMAGWLAGWLDGWMAGWLDGWMAGWLNISLALIYKEYFMSNIENNFKHDEPFCIFDSIEEALCTMFIISYGLESENFSEFDMPARKGISKTIRQVCTAGFNHMDKYSTKENEKSKKMFGLVEGGTNDIEK